MAIALAGGEGVLNGTTEVAVVAAPGSGAVRAVKTVTVFNGDSVAVTVTLSKKKDATLYPFWKGALAADQPFVWEDVIVLDAADESLVAVMGAAVTTTAPAWTAAWVEEI